MSTIATAYVQILPSTKGMKKNLLSGMSGDTDSAGSALGSSMGAKMATAISGAVAAAGIGTVIKNALDEGGKLQQSYIGGLDTLYGEAADSMRELAKEASVFGISMNDYSEQAVSFGAALKRAYGGDVVQAAEAADMAIKDMADNSAKMGTDIQSVQNAYQGFAKENYTMLDNLNKMGALAV